MYISLFQIILLFWILIEYWTSCNDSLFGSVFFTYFSSFCEIPLTSFPQNTCFLVILLFIIFMIKAFVFDALWLLIHKIMTGSSGFMLCALWVWKVLGDYADIWMEKRPPNATIYRKGIVSKRNISYKFYMQVTSLSV